MNLKIEVSESNIIDQNEYADWYLKNSGTDIKRINKAEDGKCRVKDESGAEGTFDLISVSIEWDDETREETDISVLATEAGAWAGPYEDFDCSAMMWGENTSGGKPVNVLFGIF